MPIQLTLMSLDFESFEEPVTKTLEKDEIIIGRKHSSDVVLNRPEISQQHCKLRVREANGHTELVVTDLGSANGTMLEREALTPFTEVVIQANQRIVVGSYLIKPVHFSVQPQAEIEPDKVPVAPPVAASPKKVTVKESTRDLVRLLNEVNSKESTPISAGHAVSHIADELTFEVRSGEVAEFNFNALRLVNVTGTVLHLDKPLAGVEIDAGSFGKRKTDEQGQFVISEVLEGERFTIRFSHEGFRLEPNEISVTASEQALPAVQAKALRQIRGRVLHHNNPLANVVIQEHSLGERTTAADGTFVFEGVLEGSDFQLTASKPKFRFTSIADKGHLNGADAEVTFAATELVAVSGRILHAGKPLAGVEIEAYEIGKTTTDESGQYRFEDVPEGTQCKIKICKPGFRFQRSQSSLSDH